MAEYAGLEIRIGGNTTKLNNALKASTKSAAELQRNIRQITRAMQFDPTNLKNVETRIKLTGDRMQSLQAKAQLTATAMDQIGDTLIKFRGSDKTIRDIASDTDNLTLAAKQADERYAQLTGSLAEVYEAWNKMGRIKGVDFARDLHIDAKTAEYLMSTKTSLRDFNDELDRINRRRSEGFDVEHDLITPKQLATLREFKSLNFHGMFENGLELDDVVEEARKLGIALSDDAVANVRDLRAEFKRAAEEKNAFDKALQFEQMGNDLQRVNSEAESLSQTMRWLDDSMSETSKLTLFHDAEEDIRRVDAALDLVEKDLERTEASMKVDPKNLQLAARYMQDLQQKASLTEEKTSLLNRQMQMLKSSGAKEAARDHQDLAKWIEESAESARIAKKELSEQQATVMNLDDAVKNAAQRLANSKKDFTLAEASDNVQNLARKTEELARAQEELGQAEKRHQGNAQEVADWAAALEKARKEADDLLAAEERLSDEAKRLNGILMDLDNPNISADELYSANNRYHEIGQEIGELHTKANKASSEVFRLETMMGQAQERFALSAASVEQCNDKITDLNGTIAKLKKTPEVKLLDNPEKELEEEQKSLEELQAELKQAKAEEKRRQAAYDSAAAENNLAKEAKQFQEVEQKIEEAKAKYIEATDAMKRESGSILNPSTIKSIGMTMSATVTPILAGVGRSMLDASTDIDTAYRNMRKTVDGTDDQLEELRKHAMDFASTHVTSADQILEIEALGGELGVATEDLEAFAEAISNIDVSTNLDTEEAADVLGHLSNILHLSAEDYNGFADALVRLGNNGASTESEIANIAERIGSMGSIVGMSASDVLAWASSIASTGQNAEAAGTAISKTMSFFETAVASAGGTIDTSFDAINAAVQGGGDELTVFANLVGKTSDEFSEAWASDPKAAFAEVEESVKGAKESLEGIADVAHMTADEFAQTWESDPTEAMEAFIKGLNDIEAAGGSADKVLQGFKITSVRQKQAIEGLMQTIGGLDDNLQMSKNAWNGVSDQWGRAGDAANEAAKKAEGFSGQMQIMKNVWHNALAELGEGAAPWLQRISGIVSSVSDAFMNLGSDAKEAIVAIGGIALVAGPILTIHSTLLTSISNVKNWARESFTALSIVQDTYKELGNEGVKALTGMNYGMASAKIVAKELGAAILKGLAIGAAIAAVVALGSALKRLYDQYQDHIAATKGLRTALMGIGEEAGTSASSVELTGTAVRNLANDSKGYESRLADLAHTIEESNGQYGTFAGTLSYYGDAVRDLAGKEDRTREESAKLASALQGINDACGTTYAIDEYGNIIDTQTGKIQDNTDAILANVDARRSKAVLDYYSDDYAKAVGQLTDAQDKLNEATENYNKLASDEGKQAYIDHAKEVYGAMYDEQKVLDAYNQEVSDAELAMNNYAREVANTEVAVSDLEGKMSAAQAELDKNNQILADAAKAEEEYGKRAETVASDVTGNMKKLSDAVDELGGEDAGFNAMADNLEAIHVSAEELDGVDMSALASGFDSANGSMEQIVATLEAGGVHMDTWNAALEQAPGAAENMGNLTAAAFNSMYAIAGEDINATMTLIAGLDEVQVGDKTFYIGDNGSITDSEGKVYDLKKDIDKLPNQVITKVKGDNSDAQKKVKQTNSELDKTDKKTASPKITAIDYATGKADSVRKTLDRLDGKTATTYIDTVRRERTAQATGGMNGAPVIPRHATGYIATGPTLTNQGWIGEDGIEVVANWATGGAVVPLTNKRYMLPIADAIADSMSRRMGDVKNAAPQISIVVNGVSSPDEVADAITRRLSILNF